MKRKLIMFILVFSMLASLSLSAAADDVSAHRTVEEILDEYHQKAFDAQNQDDTAAASTWSQREGNELTLEQETVNILTDAGYEAYNITADNYAYLETELKTNFSDMGLDPNKSYIVVIHGKESEGTTSSGGRSRIGLLPEQGQAPDGGEATFFTHNYNGRTFYLRYITVTLAAPYGNMYPIIQTSDPIITVDSVIQGILNTTISVAIEGNDVLHALGTVASLAGLDINDFIGSQPNTFSALHMVAGTYWDRTFTQVYVSSASEWNSYLYAERATGSSHIYSYYFDRTAGEYVEKTSDKASLVQYSPNYYNETFRKEKAIEKYLQGEPGSFYYDKTGNVKYYYGDDVVITHYDTIS